MMSVEIRKGTEVTEVVSHYVGAKNQTWVLFMSKPPPHPTPSPHTFIFKYLVWEPKFHLYGVELGGV